MKKLSIFLERPCSPLAPLLLIMFVSLGRLLLEYAIYSTRLSAMAALRDLLTMTIFYTVMFFMFTALFMLVLSRSFAAVAKLVCVGLLAGLLPPLLSLFFPIDTTTRYIYFSSFTWSLFAPEQPVSESLTIWMVISACGVFAAQVSKSIIRSIITVLGAYAIFQGCSLVFLAIKIHTFQPEAPVNLAFMGLSFFCYLGMRMKRLYGSLIRLFHALPHALLVLCGAAWSGQPLEGTVSRIGFIILVVFFMIVQNDHYDRKEDNPSAGRGRAEHLDVVWTNFFMILLFIWTLRVSPALALVLALLFLTGLLYHHPAVRLKTRFCLSYKLEGVSGLLAFLAGAVAKASFQKDRSLLLPGILVFLGATVLSIPKDWKDVEADAGAGIPTYYVILSRAGRNLVTIHRWIVAMVTLCLLIPPLSFSVAGGTSWRYLALAATALAPGAALLLFTSKRLAVAAYLLLLASYLFFLALATAAFWTLAS